MAYSSRQLYCLNAMGLVAWTSTTTKPVSSPLLQAALVTDQKQRKSASWFDQLAAQPLEEFSYKGKTVDCIGVDSAMLVVVCATSGTKPSSATADNKPMTAECMQLLDLMLRSIDIARTQVRLCVLSEQASNNTDRLVGALMTPQCRAVLFLDSSSDSTSELSDNDSGRLPESQLPVWRIPHPELLLSAPSLKRRAWQNLKALKQLPALQDRR